MRSTAAIIETTSDAPLHLRRQPDLDCELVSTNSRWGDERWYLDNQTRGQKASSSSIKWTIDIDGHGNFADPQHRDLLNTFKRLAWSLMAAPRDGGKSLKPATFSSFSVGMAIFVRWMVMSGYQKVSQLNNPAIERFKHDLPLTLAKREDEDADYEISHNSAILAVAIPIRLWQQRRELERAGIESVPEEPWYGASAAAIASEVATKAAGEIMPLPDEVAIPIMNAAHRMIGLPADDVIELQQLYRIGFEAGRPKHHSGPGTSMSSRLIGGRVAIRDFRFATIPGEPAPWHEPIVPLKRRTLWSEASKIGVVQRLRQLIHDISDAAVIVIQSTTGMRVSEICSLRAGVDKKTGLPVSVAVQPSASGLNEVFSLKAELSKTEEVPRTVEWVLGMRPRGSSILPPPVLAMLVLQRLWAPWREVVKSNDLVLHFRNRLGLPRHVSSIASCSVDSIGMGTKNFVKHYVDLTSLPDTSSRAVQNEDLAPYRDSEGTIIRTHQWRKALAHFVFNIDNRMIPALAMQFQHLSLAMTEQGYLKKNHVLLEAFDSVRAQETASLMFEIATGRSLVAGRMGDRLEEFIDPIRQMIDRVPRSEGWRNVLHFVIEKGMKLWFAPHGGCLPLDPSTMRCHQVSGTTSVHRTEANYETREPSLCAGCQCFVLDRRHADFWISRYISNWASWKRAERIGQVGEFRCVLDRANQSKALLSKLGIDITAHTNQAEALSYVG